MQIARLIFAGSIGLAAGLAAPALAKNANLNSHANAHAQKIEDKPAAQGCHAYQKSPDGSWVVLPCQEVGPSPQVSTHGKSVTRAPDEEAR